MKCKKILEHDEKILVEQFECIRLSGETNMLDRNRVFQIAVRDGYTELADEINNGKYSTIIRLVSDDKC